MLSPNATLNALTIEAIDTLRPLAHRVGRDNGRNLDFAGWEHLAEQWRAVGTIAGFALVACERAMAEGQAIDTRLPSDLTSLRRIAEALGLRDARFYRASGLDKWIHDEIKLRMAAGDRESWREVLNA